MTPSDGRLAPVSYLPGVLPPASGPSEAADAPDERAEKLGAVSQAFDNWTRDSDDASEPLAERPADKKTARRAENVSMNALTRRGMSRRELERVLLARELDESTVAAELDRLQGVGLLDDRALAHDLVSRLRDRKGLGRTAVAAELSRRLLPGDVITEALDSIESDDELETARELAIRRAEQLRSLDRATAERRLSGFLQRRGYSGDIVRTAVTEALRGTASPGVTFR
ncbi:regulatory protein RecX [Lysobacter korlensis]|uniref:Regulatory protein RecX n=1 Tax=Lysobacter korlensis TaxID=553636 RepID=A0ABV6RYS0_9GAMM